MTRMQITEAVMHVVWEIQTLSGRETPEVTLDTYPIGDLEGFDSLNAEEATVMLATELGCEIDAGIRLFCEEGEPLSVSRVSDRLCQMVGVGRG